MASPSVSEPPHASSPDPSKIKVKTTWPTIPPNASRAPIRTERLLIRPFDAADAAAIYEFRKQPEVMQWTSVGLVDKDVDESRIFVERFLAPRDAETYNFVIEYVGDSDAATAAAAVGGGGGGGGVSGVVVGSAGVHKMRSGLGWPELGYMFRKEYWGMGLATEFLRAFAAAWWALPRTAGVELEVDGESVGQRGNGGVMHVPEALMALVVTENTGSRRVLEKSGFKEFKRWNEPNTHVGCEGSEVTVIAFRLEAPGS
ncbi:putative acyl- N-acyltransferase [Rosellinia necatrix]|uniref:Putative acyl-N-acyltransferase n=1 Tax=Rosellinia necatrix TaxID=77044 RepID=A0A1W2TKI1_ROSNE|nr:putative acyl- N-acyltransferase [Rosellinia necatrix]